jgi:homocysteine S-methyltransferase
VSAAAVSAVRDRLAGGPLVLDGGLGTLLEARGNDLRSDLWSARLLAERPEEVVAAHREFFEAGAEVAISCSYQASFEGFSRAGLGSEETAGLLRRSVELARRAAESAGSAVSVGVARTPSERLVAASVGPYGAMLADGSEYRGDYGLSVAELRAWHRPRMQVLADSGADLLALETLPSIAETEAVVAEADRLGVPAWVVVTTEHGRLRSGESLDEAFRIAASAPSIVAVGINCSAPTEVTSAIGAAGRAGMPFVAYPNSGESWDAVGRRWCGEPRFDDALVGDWLDAGVSAIGGCCRVTPAHIAHVADQVRRRARVA